MDKSVQSGGHFFQQIIVIPIEAYFALQQAMFLHSQEAKIIDDFFQQIELHLTRS